MAKQDFEVTQKGVYAPTKNGEEMIPVGTVITCDVDDDGNPTVAALVNKVRPLGKSSGDDEVNNEDDAAKGKTGKKAA